MRINRFLLGGRKFVDELLGVLGCLEMMWGWSDFWLMGIVGIVGRFGGWFGVFFVLMVKDINMIRRLDIRNLSGWSCLKIFFRWSKSELFVIFVILIYIVWLIVYWVDSLCLVKRRLFFVGLINFSISLLFL